jgi:DNA-binding NtrC family response regulator
MPTSSITRAAKHSALLTPGDPRVLNMDEVVPYLVGHTVKEVERELILHTLVHHCGSRTRSARILGISIRCIRIKIHEYEDLGIAVAAPGEPRVPVRH